MSPLKRVFSAKEIKVLIDKGLIDPTKSPWACREFVVNKHLYIKRGKPTLVVNFNPLNKVLEPVRYPLLEKSSLLLRIGVALSSASST